jgi:hypothetical protein
MTLHAPSMRRLDGIAVCIRNAVRAGKQKTTEGLLFFMQTGDELIKAKQLLNEERGHGGWGRWLVANCDLSPRTARLYMQLANNRESIERKMAMVADLTIAEALRGEAASMDEDEEPPQSGWSPDEGYQYDLEKAKRAVQRAENITRYVDPETADTELLAAARVTAREWFRLVHQLELKLEPNSRRGKCNARLRHRPVGVREDQGDAV